MTRFKHAARLLSLLLALAVVFAPVASAFAADAQAGHAHADASHACEHQADGSNQAQHHPSTCTPHDSCNGQCCSCCMQCFNAAFFAPMAYDPSHPVQTPVASPLHSVALIASPERPPRRSSL